MNFLNSSSCPSSSPSVEEAGLNSGEKLEAPNVNFFLEVWPWTILEDTEPNMNFGLLGISGGSCCCCLTKLDDPEEFWTVLIMLKLLSTLLNSGAVSLLRLRMTDGLYLVLGSAEDTLEPDGKLGKPVVSPPNLKVDLSD